MPLYYGSLEECHHNNIPAVYDTGYPLPFVVPKGRAPDCEAPLVLIHVYRKYFYINQLLPQPPSNTWLCIMCCFVGLHFAKVVRISKYLANHWQHQWLLSTVPLQQCNSEYVDKVKYTFLPICWQCSYSHFYHWKSKGMRQPNLLWILPFTA